ncbi:uncharacterized protein M6B38_251865 [Iris pallida]|uniref:DUF1995 domain-containing protein n=1 Tax=Iris pallida TaxID=29817 RepID=A0AAX6IJB2_IRIPA|nr:uncharacterized protein M6B38_251865 [Iris pallida]
MFSSPSSSSSSLSLAHFNHHNHHHHSSSYSRTRSPSVRLPARAGVPARAKFDKFADATPGPPVAESQNQQPEEVPEDDEEEEQDSDLPTDLEDAIRQSSRASAAFVSSGGMRAIVELLIPQLQFLDAEGAQAELWSLSRIFLDSFIEETGIERIRAIFPDAGAAALLKYQWKDASFGFSSLSDRKPVQDEDEVVVMIVPDYQMLEYVERIASQLLGDSTCPAVLTVTTTKSLSQIFRPRPLIMWNPRLVSEDVGVGFNVRKLRKYFLSTFTTVYSMRPLPTGAVFRCYPGMWKVFYDDTNRPNRYLLAKEQPSRPDATEIELIFGDVAEESEQPPNLLARAIGMFSSVNRFMKSL